MLLKAINFCDDEYHEKTKTKRNQLDAPESTIVIGYFKLNHQKWVHNGNL